MSDYPAQSGEKVPLMPVGPTRRKRRECPECHRGNATKVVLNPGTATTVCRYCGWESTTVLADVTDPRNRSTNPTGGEQR